MLRILMALIVNLTVIASLTAEIRDPLDPFSFLPTSPVELEDKDKTAEQLIFEAETLLAEERLLDARSRLLLAIQKDPENFIPYSILSGYYMIHVGHFKLALKYALRSKELFAAQHGPAPYNSPLLKYQHAHLIHLLSQARLNLDDYEGALAALDRYADLGYHQDWYAGSRAWILMKLGRMEEALAVARVGTMLGGEPGRTLNVLGIVLSMSGRRDAAIDIFRQAIAHEFSLGRFGQPATPLNNIGEVYRELFQEQDAERSWIQATSLPDGCEHVLPSLNLAILRLEQLNVRGAKQAIDNFESCVAQYPLRSGEEHRALVHLARGRIELYSGNPDRAIEHFTSALKRQQWFGKIGATQADLELGARSSIAEALEASINRQKAQNTTSWSGAIERRWQIAQKQVLAWWHRRKAIRIFVEDLNLMEDLHIRNTDSLIDYPRLGNLLAHMSRKPILKRLEIEKANDSRPQASLYYQLYQAHVQMKAGNQQSAVQLIDELLSKSRTPEDDGIRLQALLLKMSALSTDSSLYQQLAMQVFRLNRAALLHANLPLPVNLSTSASPGSKINLDRHGFVSVTNNELDLIVSASVDEGQYSLRLSSRSGALATTTVRGRSYSDVLNQFVESVFAQPL